MWTAIEWLSLYAMTTQKDLSAFEPGKYFGLQDEVAAIKKDRTEFWKTTMAKLGYAWDGKSLLSAHLLKCLLEYCERREQLATAAVEDQATRAAAKILAYHAAVPGVLSVGVVEKAQVVIDASKLAAQSVPLPAEIPQREPGDDPPEEKAA